MLSKWKVEHGNKTTRWNWALCADHRSLFYIRSQIQFAHTRECLTNMPLFFDFAFIELAASEHTPNPFWLWYVVHLNWCDVCLASGFASFHKQSESRRVMWVWCLETQSASGWLLLLHIKSSKKCEYDYLRDWAKHIHWRYICWMGLAFGVIGSA